MTGKWCYRVQSFDQNDIIITNTCQNKKFLQNCKIRISQIQQKRKGGGGWQLSPSHAPVPRIPTETQEAGRHIPVPHMRRVWSWGLMKHMVEILLCRWLPLDKVLVRVPFSQSHILKSSPSCSHFSHFLFISSPIYWNCHHHVHTSAIFYLSMPMIRETGAKKLTNTSKQGAGVSPVPYPEIITIMFTL